MPAILRIVITGTFTAPGHELPNADADRPQSGVQRPRHHVVVVDIVAGPDSGQHLGLAAGRHLAGRARSCNIHLDDPDVEPHHAIVDVGADATIEVTQVAGRAAIDVVPGAPGTILDIGASRLEMASGPRAPAATAADPGGAFEVSLGQRLGATIHGFGAIGDTGECDWCAIAGAAHPLAGTPFVVELDAIEHMVVGVVDATGRPGRVAGRGLVRSIVVQLASAFADHRARLVTMLDVAEPVLDTLAGWSASGRRDEQRVVVVTDRPGDVRGAGSPVTALHGRGVTTTTLVIVEPASPVLNACTSVLEIGPRWRATWRLHGADEPPVRLHAAGTSAATAADSVRAVVAQKVTRPSAQLGGHVARVPQPTARQ